MATSKNIIRAAAVQIAPVLHSREGTIEKVLNAIAKAASEGAALVVFPETFVPYYPYFSFVLPPVAMGGEHMKLYEEAVTVPSPATEAVAAAAREHGVVVALGVNERDHGSIYNAQLVFDVDGTLVLHRRKITPTYHERMVWGQGDGSGLKVVDTAVGRLGALACWEHYNPLAIPNCRKPSAAAVARRSFLLKGHTCVHRFVKAREWPSRIWISV
jgi:aliphatic nitrilase